MLDLRNLSGCFRKAINNDNHISSVRVSPIKRVQSRISSMMSDKCLNEDPVDFDRRPKFQKTLLSFDIAFVLSENLPTLRTSRGMHGTSDRQTDRIRTATKSTLASGCTSRRRWTSWVLGLWKRGRSGARIAPGLFSSFFPPPRPLSLRISSTFFTDTPLHPPFAPSSRAQCYMCSLRCPVSHSPRTLFISLTLVLLPPCIQRSTPVLLSLLSARIRGWRRDFNASRAYMAACVCA